MSEWITSIEGTDAGRTLAMLLALTSAVAHAVFGAIQKGRHDPWLSRGSIDFFLFWFSIPLVLLVPSPQGWEWALIAGTLVIHFFYKLLMALAYERAPFTLVYPIVRGSGPVVTVIAAGLVFGETFTLVQWGGVALLSGGILMLAQDNLRKIEIGRDRLLNAVGIALLGGVSVAVYTTYDAYAIRATPDPFTFLAWFFFITAIDFPIIAAWRYRHMKSPPPLAPLAVRGAIGALVAYVSFGAVMLATRLDKVGEAAVLRETSTVFAAAIGWLFLKEYVGPFRAALMAVIALGAVVVEFGG